MILSLFLSVLFLLLFYTSRQGGLGGGQEGWRRENELRKREIRTGRREGGKRERKEGKLTKNEEDKDRRKGGKNRKEGK